MVEETEKLSFLDRIEKPARRIVTHFGALVVGTAIPFVAFQKEREDLAVSYRDKLIEQEVALLEMTGEKNTEIVALQRELVVTQAIEIDLIGGRIGLSLKKIEDGELKEDLHQRYGEYNMMIANHKLAGRGNVSFGDKIAQSEESIWAGDVIANGKVIEATGMVLLSQCIENESQTTYRDKLSAQPQSSSKEHTR